MSKATLTTVKTYYDGRHSVYDDQPMNYSDLAEYFSFLGTLKDDNPVFKLDETDSTAYTEFNDEYEIHHSVRFEWAWI